MHYYGQSITLRIVVQGAACPFHDNGETIISPASALIGTKAAYRPYETLQPVLDQD